MFSGFDVTFEKDHVGLLYIFVVFVGVFFMGGGG